MYTKFTSTSTPSPAQSGILHNLRVTRDAIFGVLSLINKKSSIPRKLVYVLAVVDCLQLMTLSFVTAARHDVGSSTVLGAIGNLSNVITQFTPFNLGVGFLAVNTAILVWVAGLVGTFAWVGWLWVHHDRQSIVALKLLRSTVVITATTMMLPFVSQLLKMFTCKTGNIWRDTGLECWGSWHMIYAAGAIIVLPPFILLSMIVVVTIIPQDIGSNNPAARANGRQQLALLLWKLVLAMVFTLGGEASSPWLPLLVLLATAAWWISSALSHMAWQSQTMMRFDFGLASANGMVALAVLLALIQPADSPTRDTGFVAVTGAILGYVVGYVYMQRRAMHLVACPLQSLAAQQHISLWSRFRVRLYNALQSEHARHIALEGESMSGHNKPPAVHRAMSEMSDAETSAGPETDGEDHARAVETRTVNIQTQTRDTIAYLMAQQYGSGNYDDLLADAELGFKVGMEKFSRSGQAFLDAASFFKAFHASRFMEMQTLAAARRVDNSLDVAFIVYQRLRGLSEKAAGSGSHGRQMSAMVRMQYEQQMQELRVLEVECKRCIMVVWEEVIQPVVDITKVDGISEDLRRACSRMEHLFEQCAAVNPDSVALQRMMGTYHLHIRNDAAKADEMFAVAARLADSQQRMNTHSMQHVSMLAYHYTEERLALMDDQNASLTISASPSNLGTIVAVNLPAARLFGRSVQSLMGSNVNTIIPSPFSEPHDMFLERYLRTASRTTSTIVGKTRIVVGKDSDSYLFPMRLQVEEAPPSGDDLELQISGIMQPVQTDEGVVLFLGAETGYTIVGVCRKTATEFGLTPAGILQTPLSAARLFPDLLGFDDVSGSPAATETLGPLLTSGASVCPMLKRVESRRGSDMVMTTGPTRSLLEESKPVNARMLDWRESGLEEGLAELSGGATNQGSARKLYKRASVAVEYLKFRDVPGAYLLTWASVRSHSSKLRGSWSRAMTASAAVSMISGGSSRRNVRSAASSSGVVCISPANADGASSASADAQPVMLQSAPSLPPELQPGSPHVSFNEPRHQQPDLSEVEGFSSSQSAEAAAVAGAMFPDSLADSETGAGYQPAETDYDAREQVLRGLAERGESSGNMRQSTCSSITRDSPDNRSVESKSSVITAKHRLLRRMIEGVLRDTRRPKPAQILRGVLLLIVCTFVVATSGTQMLLLSNGQAMLDDMRQLLHLTAARLQTLVLFSSVLGMGVADTVLGQPINTTMPSLRTYWGHFKLLHQLLLREGQLVGGSQLMLDDQAARYHIIDSEYNISLHMSTLQLSRTIEAAMGQCALASAAGDLQVNESRHAALLLEQLSGVLLPAMNTSIIEKQQLFDSTLESDTQLQMYIALGLIGTLTLGLLISSSLSLWKLELEKQAITRMLLFLPKWGAKLLQERSRLLHQHALHALQSEASGVPSDTDSEDISQEVASDEHLLEKWQRREGARAREYLQSRKSGKQSLEAAPACIKSDVSYSESVTFSTKPPRPYRASYSFVIHSVVRLMLPLPLILAWPLLLYLLLVQQQETVVALQRREFLISQLVVDTSMTQIKLCYDGLQDWASRSAWPMDVYAASQIADSRLSLLLHGGDVAGHEIAALDQSTTPYLLATADACVASSQQPACEAWLDGMNARGLEGWLRRFWTDAQRMAEQFAASNATSMAQALAANSELASLRTRLSLTTRYITDNSMTDATVQAMFSAWNDALAAQVNGLSDQLRVIVIVMNIIVALLFVVFWSPTANSLGNSLAGTRTLLMVTPQVALSRVPAVATLVNLLAKESQAAYM